LKHAAIDQDLQALLAGSVTGRINKVFGSGYGACRAEKLKIGHNVPDGNGFVQRFISPQRVAELQMLRQMKLPKG
jgi:hypothetical protein